MFATLGNLAVMFLHVPFQSVDKEKFEVCLKDIQRYDAQHDAVTINLMVIGRE